MYEREHSTFLCRCNWLRGDSFFVSLFLEQFISRKWILMLVHSQNFKSLQWRYNGRDGFSHHRPHDCLLNRLFRRRSKQHQSSASQAFVLGIHRWPVYSPHKWPVTRKRFAFDDAIMNHCWCKCFITQLGATSFQQLEALFHYWLGHR